MRTRKLLIFLGTTACTLAPAFVLAQSSQCQGICNPLSSAYSTIPTFIAGFLRVMVQIGLPVVALFLLIAGYRFASAGGNSGKLEEAKENFVYVIIGALLILGAWVLATLIGNTVSQVVGVN
jgi:hypothetical protein